MSGVGICTKEFKPVISCHGMMCVQCKVIVHIHIHIYAHVLNVVYSSAELIYIPRACTKSTALSLMLGSSRLLKSTSLMNLFSVSSPFNSSIQP